MNKRKIINDVNFMKRCREYGLDWNMVEMYESDNELYLYIPTIDLNHMIIMDNNYNIIGIEKKDINRYLSDMIDTRITLCKTANVHMKQPFINYSIQDINNIANYIDIDLFNQVNFNEKKVNDQTLKSLLAYLKLLKQEISDYYLRSYHLIMQDFSVPNVEDYIASLTKNIDIKNLNNTSEVLRHLGLWYQRKDQLTKLIRIMMEGFNQDTNYNQVNELSSVLLTKVKNNELIKK